MCGFKDEDVHDDVEYINTSFDKALIEYYQEDDVPEARRMHWGNTEITDRFKLIRLLELLKAVNYKYLIIDIRFPKGLECDSFLIDSISGQKQTADEKLFSLINQLDRVVIATHHDIKLIHKDVEKKAALADYRSTATATNFVRYEYFDSIPYIPLAVYNDLNKREGLDTISCHYPFGLRCLKPFAYYTQGNRLCYNSLFLNFSIRGTDKGSTEDGQTSLSHLSYLNLSKEILDKDNAADIVKNFENKYIVVCNYTQDLHDTYAGAQPGGVILYNALKALNNNKHIISWVEVIILFILFFLISFFILNGNNIFDLFKKSENSLLNFIIDISSFNLILYTYNIIEYMIWRTSYSFVLPILVFTVMKTYILINKKYKMGNKLFVVFLALLSGLLMSFTSQNNDGNDKSIEVHEFNSNAICIDEDTAKIGKMISLKSSIKLNHPNLKLKLLNKGEDISITCRIHNKKETWKKGEYREVFSNEKGKENNLLWWLTWHKTSDKGSNVFQNSEYLVGDERPFRIEDPIINPAEQYYEFIVNEGRYKGKSFMATPDDTDPVIWVSREILNKSGIHLNSQGDDSLNFKVIYHNFGDIIIIKNSFTIVFSNITE